MVSPTYSRSGSRQSSEFSGALGTCSNENADLAPGQLFFLDERSQIRPHIRKIARQCGLKIWSDH